MEISAQRRDAVEKAREAWIKKLIDLSRRNNLLYYRPLKWGTLTLSPERPELLPALLHGENIPLRDLAKGTLDEDLMAKVLTIWRRSQTNQEEKGLATMFVALGMANWKAPDEGRNPEAPVLLLPVGLELKGRSGVSVSVHRVGPVQTNLVLFHVLQAEYGISIPSNRLASLLEGHDEEDVFDATAVYSLVEEACRSIPDFGIKQIAVLGNFAFQKMAMVRDLKDNLDHLLSSDLIAALAGDTEAKQSIGAKEQDLDPKEFDRIPPQSEFLVIDADSSQQSAIAAILKCQSAVIHGPPGTGKSQTIANVIASLNASGKSVLFVAEKRAALQAVLKRLQRVGLDKLAIDLHGADVSPRRVVEQIAGALDAVRHSVPVDCDEMHKRYVERRDRLNRHVERLHRKCMPGGISVYELQGILLHLQAQVRADTRWRRADLNRIEAIGPAKVRDLFREAAGFASLFLRRDPSPWNGVELRDGAAAQEALDQVAGLSSRTWPDFIASFSEIINATGFKAPGTLEEVHEARSLIDAVEGTLKLYSPQLFGQNIRLHSDALAAGCNGGARAIWNWCTRGEYRKARAQVLACRTAGKAPTATLFTELTAAEEQRVRWAELTGGLTAPVVPPCVCQPDLAHFDTLIWPTVSL